MGDKVGFQGWMILLAGALIAFIRPFVVLNSVRAYRNNGEVRHVVRTYWITPESYSVTGNRSNVDLKWDAFCKAVETKCFTLLYASSESAHFIPKAAIASGSDLRAVRAMTRGSLGSKTHLEKDVEGEPG